MKKTYTTANFLKSVAIIATGTLMLAQTATAQATLQKIFPTDWSHAMAPVRDARTTSATGSRLIAYAILGNNGAAYIPYDSLTCTYSGTRGGDLTHQPLKYDNDNQYLYNTTAGSYTQDYISTQTFDANNNILTAITQMLDGVTSAFRNYNKDLYTYDAGNNMLTDINQSWDTVASTWADNYQIFYTYDASNNKLSSSQQNWNSVGSVWINAYKYLYTYSPTNQLLSSITQTWNTTTDAWVNDTKNSYTYDASGNNTGQAVQNWSTGTSAWINSSQDVFTFDASNDELTDLSQIWVAGSSSWVNSFKETNSSFVDTHPQLSIRQQWDPTTSVFVNSQQLTYAYNSYDQYTTAYSTSWNVGGFWEPTTNDIGYRFYYENYTTAVKNITNTNCTATTYPIPANDVLHISVTWNDAQPFSITMMNMNGNVVSSSQMAASKTYNGNVATGNLPAGNYVIKITGTDAQSVQQVVIVR